MEEIRDREELRTFLLRDKLANAYLLGDLDPDYFPFCEWWGARDDDGELESLMLLYKGLSLPAVWSVGSKEGFAQLLRRYRSALPNRFHFHLMGRHLPSVKQTYDLADVREMRRMGLRRSDYSSLGHDSRVRRLGHSDTAAIMRLYEHYPDNFFEPSQLETGLYFGVDGEDDELKSIAGVHVLSEAYDVAAIGNLVTHPDARGQGLATACTGRLLDELFERVSLVALNVRRDNLPAISVYENFGFDENSTFWEGRGMRAAGDEMQETRATA
jgi:GNAT superfamily N-acetyltransferase